MKGLFGAIGVRLRATRRKIEAGEAAAAAAQSDTIGVLLVHGIGDQGRFQFLDETARNLADALRYIETDPKAPQPRVSVSMRASGGSLMGAAAPTLSEGGGPAAEIVVRRCDGTIVRFAIHEAWWGDVIEPATSFRPFFFFLWGLGMWAAPLQDRSKKDKPGTIQGEPLPKESRGPPTRIRIRAQLFIVCYLILVFGGLLSVISVFFRVFQQNVPNFLLLAISYMSDIKLYTQPTVRRLAQTVPLDWAGQHARFAIRARAIRGLAEMALCGYRQWWVMGHSMGSVVGFSALVTPDARLPLYLDEPSWKKLKDGGYVNRVSTDEDEIGKTRIAVPAWLKDGEGIDRAKLFTNLQGLVTFGSPLDKFAYIWPLTVSVACDQKPLARKHWLNVHDATDPVAGALDAFKKAGATDSEFTPTNLGYAASRVPLLSHLCYLLTPAKAQKHGFGASLVRWWLDIHDGKTKPRLPGGEGPRWAALHPARWLVRRIASGAFWLAMTVVAPVLLAVLFKLVSFLTGQVAADGLQPWWNGIKAMAHLDWWADTAGLAISPAWWADAIGIATRPEWWADAIGIAARIAAVAAAAVFAIGTGTWLYASLLARKAGADPDGSPPPPPGGGSTFRARPSTADNRAN